MNVTYKKARALIGRIAYALLTNAREYVRTHTIRYQSQPEKCPIKKWEKEWLQTGIARMQGSTVVCAFPEDMRDTRYLTMPDITDAMLTDARQRNDSRKARQQPNVPRPN